MSYRFLLFPEDKSVLLNDILSTNKWHMTVTAKFQFWHLERPWQQWQWTGLKYNSQFSYLEPSWTLCEEKNHKAHIRKPMLSMQSIPCHFINLLKPTCYVMHQKVWHSKLYALSMLYLCVLYLSENKQQLVPLIP